ncbi:hypothetical protein M6B38_397590 [Iris pallida]|uniref:Uncharacterized protein n=1 Tax=Iris pallida TaxID=29817 RepID=A0AAX6FWV2_IRIPA|nr:hypothetical protein M6B38_397590 [Iris pallida]
MSRPSSTSSFHGSYGFVPPPSFGDGSRRTRPSSPATTVRSSPWQATIAVRQQDPIIIHPSRRRTLP